VSVNWQIVNLGAKPFEEAAGFEHGRMFDGTRHDMGWSIVHSDRAEDCQVIGFGPAAGKDNL
jgi:hypothetical protein